jgi:hypothetical protein
MARSTDCFTLKIEALNPSKRREIHNTAVHHRKLGTSRETGITIWGVRERKQNENKKHRGEMKDSENY